MLHFDFSDNSDVFLLIGHFMVAFFFSSNYSAKFFNFSSLNGSWIVTRGFRRQRAGTTSLSNCHVVHIGIAFLRKLLRQCSSTRALKYLEEFLSFETVLHTCRTCTCC